MMERERIAERERTGERAKSAAQSLLTVGMEKEIIVFVYD